MAAVAITSNKIISPTVRRLGWLIVVLFFVQANSVRAALITGVGEPQFSAPTSVQVALDDTAVDPGNISFTVNVLPGPNIGDIRGVYFHVADESLLAGLSVSGSDVTDSKFLANSVRKLGSNTWINPHGDFDIGIEIGTTGIEADDIQSTTFVISHDTVALNTAQFALQKFGIRLSNVGPDGGRRSHLTYSKLTGTLRAIPEPGSAVPVAWITAVCLSRRSLRRNRVPG